MKKAVDLLQKLQLAVGTLFLAIFLITVVLQVSSRYLGFATVWTEEVAMYAFIWAVFMGASAMVYEKRHFAFTSLSENLKSESLKSIISIVISIIMLIFAVLMVQYGVQVTKQFWNYKWISIPSLTRGITWMCLPICGVTSFIYLIQLMIEDFKNILKGDAR
ncbi:MAG: C4-dicarboxylate transporter permease [Clostridia bacterium]|jgi:TRAP-type C4-dicarboxylate transport system permease small subunit|nr:C4-dicarboxylate transporter permease [Clostridia bacterium]